MVHLFYANEFSSSYFIRMNVEFFNKQPFLCTVCILYTCIMKLVHLSCFIGSIEFKDVCVDVFMYIENCTLFELIYTLIN